MSKKEIILEYIFLATCMLVLISFGVVSIVKYNEDTNAELNIEQIDKAYDEVVMRAFGICVCSEDCCIEKKEK